jgi:peptidoglycan/LPS O-acetylase OafA/YrhL
MEVNPLVSSFRYRPEVDGLRAIAVLAVVFFHAGLGVTGGYIGVDVFFVISGFLITSLIIKDLESGEFTPVKFWERQARRIIPAMLVVVLTTLVAGWFLLLPGDYRKLGISASLQAVFGVNVHYWLDTGYFAGAAEEKPLLHTCSLAVEEQFYMVVPLLLLGLFRISAFRHRRMLLSWFATGIAVSLLAIKSTRTTFLDLLRVFYHIRRPRFALQLGNPVWQR